MTFETIYLTPEETTKLVAAGNGNAALVYVYMKSSGDYALKEAEKQLRMQRSEIEWAETLLKQLGLVKANVPTTQFDKDHAPSYTSRYIQDYAKKDSTFKLFQEEIGKKLGRPLNAEELKTLLAIREYLLLPDAVVIMALTYCLQKNERYNQNHGTQKTVSMRTLEKECYLWANDGIHSVQDASVYISEKAKALEPMSQLKKALGIDRKLGQTEESYLESWLKMGFVVDAIKIAYDKTVVATGKLAWRYMDKILMNWHEKNLHTAEEVQNEGRRGNLQKTQNLPSGSSFTPGQEELSGTQSLRKILDEMKG